MDYFLKLLLQYTNVWGPYVITVVFMGIVIQWLRSDLKEERKNSQKEREQHHEAEMEFTKVTETITTWIKTRLK